MDPILFIQTIQTVQKQIRLPHLVKTTNANSEMFLWGSLVEWVSKLSVGGFVFCIEREYGI